MQKKRIMMISWRRCTKEELCGVKKESEWANGKDLKSKCRQVAKGCGFLLSQWYLIWKEIYCPFFFFYFIFFSRKSKERRNSSIPITFLSIFLSRLLWTSRALSHSLEVCNIFVLMAMCSFARDLACDLVVEDFVI